MRSESPRTSLRRAKAKKALEEKDAADEYPIEEEPVKEGTSIEDMEPEPEPASASASEAEAEAEVVKKGSEVSDDIKDSLESDDPWMQRKQEKQ